MKRFFSVILSLVFLLSLTVNFVFAEDVENPISNIAPKGTAYSSSEKNSLWTPVESVINGRYGGVNGEWQGWECAYPEVGVGQDTSNGFSGEYFGINFKSKCYDIYEIRMNIGLHTLAGGQNATYTIEAFENSEYSAGSLMYGFIAEDEEYGEYPAGTWLYEGNEGIAGATAGELKVSVSGSTYTLKYTLYDDEYGITFTGTYTGSLTIYDGTQEYSYAAALPSFAPRATKANTKYFKVRR